MIRKFGFRTFGGWLVAGCAFAMVFGGAARAAEEVPGLRVNGTFRPLAREEVRNPASDTEVLVKSGGKDAPTGWSVNPSYSGGAVVVEGAGGEPAFVRLTQTGEKPVGIWFFKRFPVEAASYRIAFEYRGTGNVWVALTLYQGPRFLSSVFGKKLPSVSAQDWQPVEQTLTVPGGDAETLKPQVFASEGPIEVRNLTVVPVE
jgi:hypothetical protein